ncbi:MAG: bifunctional diguanylate cyclase/phosphodiesterase [Pseudomonadota bacterium]
MNTPAQFGAPGDASDEADLRTRTGFLRHLAKACTASADHGATLGLLVIDIDHFRRINAAFGYRMGDGLLAHFYALLGRAIRPMDRVGGLGGDRFGVVLPKLMNDGHAVLAAAKILRLLENGFELQGQKINISATIGIAVQPDHGSHPDLLLRLAEQALDQAREEGADYRLARADKALDISSTWDIEFELQDAIRKSELELYYQPQMDLKKMTPVGAEALMRWNSPTRGRVSPGDFIPVAERCGLVRSFTQWAVNTAVQQSNRWSDRFGQLTVSINVPAPLLRNRDLVDLIQSTSQIWNTPVSRIVVEITESSAMADPEVSFDRFAELRELGAHIAIDDFGTGYSSLSYFQTVPADEIKIDQSFVRDLVKNPADQAIAQSVIDLSHRFKKRVVAEGIEDAGTYKALAKMGCDIGQGYFIARPMPAADFEQWLTRFDGMSNAGPRLSEADAEELSARQA